MGISCCENLNKYEIIGENIGKGSNSEIYKGTKDGKYYAMKKGIKDEERTKKELDNLKNFDHYNIVEYIEPELYEIKEKENKGKYIIMELCESNLRKFIVDKKNKNELIDEKVIYVILKDICYGLKEIHSKNFIHGNLSPENILIGSDKKFKIAGFNISKDKNKKEPLTYNMDDKRYAAPEYLPNQNYNEKIDLWSLGCIICELCSSEFPSKDNSYNAKPKINDKYNKKLQELIDKILVRNPEERIDLTKIIKKINNLDSECERQNEDLDELSEEILNRKKENEIKIYLEIKDEDLNKYINFLGGDKFKELNKKNTELYIYQDKHNKNNEYDFGKRYKFEQNGDHKILLKLKKKITYSSFMFLKCSKLKNIDLTFFDTSNIKNMSNMFDNCVNLEKIDLSSFDISNVDDMSSMFKGCIYLKDINLSSFKKSKVKKMCNMFEDCENLEKLDLSSFIPSKDIEMDDIFKNCKNLTDFKGFKSFKKTFKNDELKKIFKDCPKLINKNEIKLYLKIEDVDLNNDIYFLDNNGDNLKELNKENTELYIYKENQSNKSKENNFIKKCNFNCIGNYKILLKLKLKMNDSSFMFYQCSKLKNIDLIFFDASNIINMKNMFAYCENLKILDLSFFDTSKVENMSSLFKG